MSSREKGIGKIYLKYLTAAFGSALISCIYGMVDMAAVGRYCGPDGTAALAVVAPVWNIIYSLGLLTGIGGSVLLGTVRAKRDGNEEGNRYFTVSVILSLILAAFAWGMLWAFERPVLRFFGATDEKILSLAGEYLKPIRFVFPLFLMNQMLAAFLRNDKAPALATAGVLAGGIFNVFGDICFTFTFDLGVFGAGLATAFGSVITFCVQLSHFFTRRNTLRFVSPKKFFAAAKEICVSGFSSFFIDVAMGILTVIFNRQIMRYLGADALAVYGAIINVSTFVQCCAYSVGQASQPMISSCFGSAQSGKIAQILKYALFTAAAFGVFWTALSLICPGLYVRIFMDPTPRISEIAPAIIRSYSISFLLLPFNIFSVYYFQSIMKPGIAFIVSVARGLVISGALILLLPLAGADLVWFSMPITELVVAVYAVSAMIFCTRSLSAKIGRESDRAV